MARTDPPRRADLAALVGVVVAVAALVTGAVGGAARFAVPAALVVTPLVVAVDARSSRRPAGNPWTGVALVPAGLGLAAALALDPGAVAAVLALPWAVAGAAVAAPGIRRWREGTRSPAAATTALGHLAVPVGGVVALADRAGVALAAAQGPAGLPIPGRALAVAGLAHLLAGGLVAAGATGDWINASGRVGSLAWRAWRGAAVLVLLGAVGLAAAIPLPPAVQAVAVAPLAAGGVVTAGLVAVAPVGREFPGGRAPPRWRRVAARVAFLVAALGSTALVAFVAVRAGYGAVAGSPVDVPAFVAGLPPWLAVGPVALGLVAWGIHGSGGATAPEDAGGRSGVDGE